MLTRIRFIGAILALALVGFDLLATPAQAAARPYGGCAEAWQAPHSRGAAQCRHAGWTVRPHFVIDPHNRLRFTDFKPCEYEDSNGCIWNALTSGNGVGTSFVASLRGEVFYVAIMR